jgi:hypothetical protein
MDLNERGEKRERERERGKGQVHGELLIFVC